MECTRSQQWIEAGLRPGTRSPEQLQLGFHVAGCERCQTLLRRQASTNEVFLATLLATTPPPRRSQVAPRRRRAWPLVSTLTVLGLIGVVLMSNLVVVGKMPAPATSSQGQLAPSAAPTLSPAPPAPQVEPTLTPTSLARPAGGRLPDAGYAPRPTIAMPPELISDPQLPSSRPAALSLAPRNILLLGLDRRPGETAISRADSILILHIDPISPSLALLSLPRDLWVLVPGTEHWVKLNAAYSWGEALGGAAEGAELARLAVEQVIGQPIDHTMVITFQGLMGLVDQLGGIEVNVPQAIYDATFPTFDYGYMIAQFVPGMQQMDGFTALVYSRTRHADSDFQRARRQQLVLLAMFQKLQQLARTDSASLASLSVKLQGNFEYLDVDRFEALKLAETMATVDLATVRREAVDLRFGAESSTIDGAYIIMPDLVAIHYLAADLFGR